MNVRTFEHEEDWQQARIGKITGSKLKDLIVKRGTGQKIGFYQLIADRLALPHDGENVMDRGKRLETEALELVAADLGGVEINSSLVLWERDDNQNIAVSPDGFIGHRIAFEVKCLNSARHIEALVTQKIPSDYEDQVLQYFVVNDELEQLHFVFYDPRLVTKQFFYLTVYRKDVAEKVADYLAKEREMLTEVDRIVGELSEL